MSKCQYQLANYNCLNPAMPRDLILANCQLDLSYLIENNLTFKHEFTKYLIEEFDPLQNFSCQNSQVVLDATGMNGLKDFHSMRWSGRYYLNSGCYRHEWVKRFPKYALIRNIL